jgi:signal transduction histidine kinase
MSTEKPVSEQEIRNTLQTIDLLAKQIRANRVESDYALRQIDKVKNLLNRVAETQEKQHAVGRFEALYNVSRLLGSSLNLQKVLDQVMDAVIQLTGAERGFLMLRDDDGNLAVQAARNFDQETLNSNQQEYSRTIANLVVDTGETVLTTNALEDPRFKSQQSVMAGALRSVMAVPLWARGRVIGLAYVENRIVTGLFTKEDLETLEALVGQASVAIDNAILFAETDEELAKRVDELRLLRRIDLQLNQTLDPDAAMNYTLKTACRIAGATEGHLGILQGDPKHLMATHHFSTEKDLSDNANIILLEEAYPKVWDAVNQHKTMTFDSGQYGLMSVMAIPIMLEKIAVGVVVLIRKDGGSFMVEQQDLVERVVVRAAVNIENARLYVAVQAADRAKTEFVGIVAHDLKAPMTGIRGYADLMAMQGENLTERQQRFLRRISDTVRRMENLVSDLADISRIESGQFFMDEMRVTVDSVIEAMRDTVMPQMEERKHNFVEKIEDNLPDIWTDYYRLVQVLTNLLSNAYKYTHDGGTITLEAKHNNGRIHFSISDTGVGLSKEQIKMLGIKFWRAEDEYTRSQPGTGLGFSITRSLVEQMGSSIHIESEIDKGSTFAFSVAVARKRTDTLPATDEPSES